MKPRARPVSPGTAATVLAAAVATASSPPALSSAYVPMITAATAAFDVAVARGLIQISQARKTLAAGAVPALPNWSGPAPALRILFVESLAAKPAGEQPAGVGHQGAPKRAAATADGTWDPFARAPCELVVSRNVGGSRAHMVMLNRYPAVRTHILVVAGPEARQCDPLDADDFEATDAVLRDALGGDPVLAFYNCGPCSGSSVARRHVQVLAPQDAHQCPSASASTVFKAGGVVAAEAAAFPLAPLLRAGASEALGLAVFADANPSAWASAGASARFRAYRRLLAAAKEAYPGVSSHSLLFTRSWMAVIPRRSASAFGVSVNSASYTGTLLAKSQSEVNAILSLGGLAILQAAAYPPVKSSKT